MVRLHDPLPLPAAEAQAIRQWLNQPACRKFIDNLCDRAAALSARAGNALIENANDAQVIADEARTLVEARKVIELAREPGYQFVTVKLDHETAITPTNYASRTDDHAETFPGSSIPPVQLTS